MVDQYEAIQSQQVVRLISLDVKADKQCGSPDDGYRQAETIPMPAVRWSGKD